MNIFQKKGQQIKNLAGNNVTHGGPTREVGIGGVVLVLLFLGASFSFRSFIFSFVFFFSFDKDNQNECHVLYIWRKTKAGIKDGQ